MKAWRIADIIVCCKTHLYPVLVSAVVFLTSFTCSNCSKFPGGEFSMIEDEIVLAVKIIKYMCSCIVLYL